jgi:hypothetical protein
MTNPLTGRFKSLKVADQLPQFFDFEESTFPLFIKYYYEWMESNTGTNNTGGPDYWSRRIMDFNDLDYKGNGYQQFEKFLIDEFMRDIPSNLQVDERLLLKNIKDFYKAKGTESAITLLFRILYNEDVEFDYPGKYILRASDGRWSVEESLKILPSVPIENISSNDFLVGAASGAISKIQRIEQRLEDSVIVTEVFISNKFGNYVDGERLLSKLENLEIGTLTFGGFTTYPGKYLTTDGWLSSDRVLQDNHYYQEFSYVIKSAKDPSAYSDVLKELAHPAGSIFFGEYNLRIELDNTLDVNSFVPQYSKEISYNIPLNDFFNFSLESDVHRGQIAGRYILEYTFNAVNYASFITDTVSSSGTGVVSGQNITVTGMAAAVAGDVLEIYAPVSKRSTEVTIQSVISPGVYKLRDRWVYSEVSGLIVRLRTSSVFNSNISTFRYNRDTSTGLNSITIQKLDDYVDIDQLNYLDIADLSYNDLLSNKFVFGTDFSSEPIRKGTILSVHDIINNQDSTYFIKGLLGNTIIQLRDTYQYTPSASLSYKLINH